MQWKPKTALQSIHRDAHVGRVRTVGALPGPRNMQPVFYGVVRCSGMVSSKEDKGLRYRYPVTIAIKAPAPLRSRGIVKSTTKLI
ncbi:hypothetical protein B296_00047675 [Ensete ventricosum]|uniref:Uncharacterized protein n=1 Tax=Ensete ventricosum TaxID=4639 RepID=A0A426X371_ENSVE|nr:hypothetical protein B296_00047675 [Ensete ventricosum]